MRGEARRRKKIVKEGAESGKKSRELSQLRGRGGKEGLANSRSKKIEEKWMSKVKRRER